MVKNFIHILRTYLITFRYLKKNEINNLVFFSNIFIYVFVCFYLNSLLFVIF